MKKYLSLICFACFFSIQISFSQISFEKTFGDTADVERSFCAKQTYDGGYIVLGTNFDDDSGSGFTLMLIKTDSLGNEIWRKTWLDFTLWQAQGASLKITSDSGFIITGGSFNSGGGPGALDVFLLKTDKDGNQQWAQTYDSLETYTQFGISHEYGNDVMQTTDGNYFVAGAAGSEELFLLKTDSIGNLQFLAKDTGLANATGNALVQSENNTFLVAGSSTPNPNLWNTPKMYVAKFDSSGNKIWGQSYSWNQGNYARGYAIQISSDGKYLLSGLGRYNSSQYGKMIVFKTDTAGNFIWENSFLLNNYTAGYSLANTSDNGFALTGYSYDSIYGYSTYLVKTDSVGTLLWDTTYSGEIGYSIQQTSDSGYILAGVKAGDIYLLKTGINGNVTSANYITSENEYSLSVFPNPSGNKVNIFLETGGVLRFSMEIINETGKLVSSIKNLSSNKEIILDKSFFVRGINIIKILNSSGVYATRKILVYE